MLDSVRAVLQRHQCVAQTEAVSTCMRAHYSSGAGGGAAKPSALHKSSPCAGYVNALRYCELATSQHNFPASTHSYLF